MTLTLTSSTLLCCALPIALVTLGMGATVVSLVAAVPFIITLSEYKIIVFSVSGLLTSFSAWLMYRPGRFCPADPELAAACNRFQIWNRRILLFSSMLWLTGFFAAFLALPVMLLLED